jgi:hypothetical protein
VTCASKQKSLRLGLGALTVGYNTFVLYTLYIVRTEKQESAKFLELSKVSFWLDSGSFKTKASGTPPLTLTLKLFDGDIKCDM